ncbi:unnamed protein product [Lathyrus sativus]|nr:unnamed protein product [Lathyrus sativus]
MDVKSSLKLLRGLHSLWSPSRSQALPGEIRSAMTVGDVERLSHLEEENPKLTKNLKDVNGEPNESDTRN